MKTSEERKAAFPRISALFEQAINDRLKKIANQNGGVYIPSAPVLCAQAMDAMNEIVEAEAEFMTPMLAIALWESSLKINESAYRQGLARLEKAGTLGFKVGGGAKQPKAVAMQYV